MSSFTLKYASTFKLKNSLKELVYQYIMSLARFLQFRIGNVTVFSRIID